MTKRFNCAQYVHQTMKKQFLIFFKDEKSDTPYSSSCILNKGQRQKDSGHATLVTNHNATYNEFIQSVIFVIFKKKQWQKSLFISSWVHAQVLRLRPPTLVGRPAKQQQSQIVPQHSSKAVAKLRQLKHRGNCCSQLSHCCLLPD